MRNEFRIRNIKDSDLNDVLSIFNYYVKNGFAAYPEKEVDITFFRNIKQNTHFFYVLELKARIIGFAFLKNYLPYENFKHIGQITYFLNHKYTNKGFGTLILNKLIKDAKEHGIFILLANLSSLNQQSLKFHENHGFVECGRFKNIAKKFNQDFDIIWMQRNL
ncbi:MAG: GNAT family N-acetyltransferase [Candidatus Thorarchaeota archaeon]